MAVKVLFYSICASALICPTYAAERFELPSPDGCCAVGAKQIFLTDKQRNREFAITIWYPATAGSPEKFSPYMDSKTADVFAQEWKLRPGFEHQIDTNSELNAQIQSGTFPVVLLEHGSGMVPAIYTILAEGLASNGFIVVAANRPYSSALSVFPDGHVLKFAPYWPEDADRTTQGIAIGKYVEGTLVSDVRFILDELAQIETNDRFWHGHLDLSKVGIVGHSLGGAIAAIANRDETRIRAAVNVDGSTYPGMNADVRPVKLGKPFLFLATQEHASGESKAREYFGIESNTYYVVIDNADHMSFTDLNLLANFFSRETKQTQTDFQRQLVVIESTKSLITEFLSKYLKGNPVPNLDLNWKLEKQ